MKNNRGETKYVVVVSHDRFEKGQILSEATPQQIAEGLVVPIQSNKELPRQAQINPQLADAAEDEGFQNLSELS